MYIEKTVKSKVLREYDVAVCGGGFAGISAALAAARQGKKTVLLEKQFILGGLATAGLVTIYLPLCDGMGNQVSFGIAEELFMLSIKHGAEDKYPENWLDNIGTRTQKDKRFEVRYNPHLFAILVEDLLQKAGVDIVYGTFVVDTVVEDEKIRYLIVENKSGRNAYKVGSVVDATGDCDIANIAGLPTTVNAEGNSLAAWYYSMGKSGYTLNLLGVVDVPDEQKNNNETPLLEKNRFFGTDGEELSKMMCMSHRATYNHFIKKRSDDETHMPVTLATIPQIRMTRKLVGEFEMEYTQMHTYFDDSIGMVSDWRKRGPIFEVPYRTLYNKSIRNLIAAGRCTSVDAELWDVMRVIPCCAVTGQAAGTAAAMTDDFAALDVKELQNQLVKDGVVLHEKDIIK